MVRILNLSDKKFIESQRALGVICQAIREELGVHIHLIYKWTALIKIVGKWTTKAVNYMAVLALDFQQRVEPNFLNTLKNLQLEMPFDWKITKINTTF